MYIVAKTDKFTAQERLESFNLIDDAITHYFRCMVEIGSGDAVEDVKAVLDSEDLECLCDLRTENDRYLLKFERKGQPLGRLGKTHIQFNS